jgi:hypothetical protein
MLSTGRRARREHGLVDPVAQGGDQDVDAASDLLDHERLRRRLHPVVHLERPALVAQAL